MERRRLVRAAVVVSWWPCWQAASRSLAVCIACSLDHIIGPLECRRRLEDVVEGLKGVFIPCRQTILDSELPVRLQDELLLNLQSLGGYAGEVDR